MNPHRAWGALDMMLFPILDTAIPDHVHDNIPVSGWVCHGGHALDPRGPSVHAFLAWAKAGWFFLYHPPYLGLEAWGGILMAWVPWLH